MKIQIPPTQIVYNIVLVPIVNKIGHFVGELWIRTEKMFEHSNILRFNVIFYK